MGLTNGYTIGVLGCGNMGTAVLNAMLEAQAGIKEGDIVPGRFLASVSSEASQARLEKAYGSKVTIMRGENERLVRESDVVVVGCKPYLAKALLQPISDGAFKDKLVISLLAGTTIATLTELTGGTPSEIARAMTNTPAKIGHGMTVVSFADNSEVDAVVKSVVEWIFTNTGRCLFLDEKHQDVATALCGSGPAFCYLVMEAMIDGAVQMGMPYSLAQECAAQVMKGAGEMVHQEGHPAVLRSKVCTPGGTTIGGLMVMEDNKVRSGVARAIQEATQIATALGKKS
ncbi:pyrroline-5-carboxylate reductase [Trichomonascus vanleenenianus]|uniref:pyrroline-5-carboxylate reductase n=1 Tax=Trichomonascus vanleenenianus TaxID=2268995 RepID=UPI003ECAEE61